MFRVADIHGIADIQIHTYIVGADLIQEPPSFQWGKEESIPDIFNANCHIRSFRFGCQSAQCVLRTLIGNIVPDLFWVFYKIATDITGNNQNRFSPQKVRSFNLL